MKESAYYANQATIHQAAADNPDFEPWVRKANRDHAVWCRRLAAEAKEIEDLEDCLAEDDFAVQAQIDEIRSNQETRYLGKFSPTNHSSRI